MGRFKAEIFNGVGKAGKVKGPEIGRDFRKEIFLSN